jgi:hypothetical protein
MDNRLLQRLDFAADTTGSSIGASDRRQVENFRLKIPSGGGTFTLAAGSWMQFDTAQTGADRTLVALEAVDTFATGNPLVIGVLLDEVSEAQTASDRYIQVRVIVAGYAEAAKVDNAVAAAGTALVVDNTAAGGTNALAAADVAPACGVALEAAAGNRADVWVLKNF